MIKIERYSYPEKLIDTSKDDFEVIEIDTGRFNAFGENCFGEILRMQIETKLKTIFPKPEFEIMITSNSKNIPENIIILFKNKKHKDFIERWINKEGYNYEDIDIRDRFVFDIKENQSFENISTTSKNKNSVIKYLTLFHKFVIDYLHKNVNINVKAAIYKNKLITFDLIPTGKGVNDDIVFLAKNISSGILSYTDGLNIKDKFTFMKNYFES